MKKRLKVRHGQVKLRGTGVIDGNWLQEQVQKIKAINRIAKEIKSGILSRNDLRTLSKMRWIEKRLE